jgi:AcrR family transcriptional regulator
MARSLSEDARAKMLHTATDLVLEVGVDGFSVDEVARRSGVAKTTIYRRFSSAKELLVAALDRVMTAPSTPDTGSLREDLLEYLASVRPAFADITLRNLFFEIYAASARDPELRDLHKSLMRARAGPTRAIFDHARLRGELSPELDYVTMAEIVQGPFIVRSMFRPETLADVDLEALADRMITLLKA